MEIKKIKGVAFTAKSAVLRRSYINIAIVFCSAQIMLICNNNIYEVSASFRQNLLRPPWRSGTVSNCGLTWARSPFGDIKYFYLVALETK